MDLSRQVGSSVGGRQTQDRDYENEWSRLLATVGKDSLRRLQQSKILLIGLNGLGAEIAKNIVLMGAQSLTIHDTTTVSFSDLSAQFFLSPEDVGKRSRAAASLAKIKELNERVQVNVHDEKLTHSDIVNFKVVVCCDCTSQTEMIATNNFCRANGITYIAGAAQGLFGWVFVDGGDKVISTDRTGEPPKTAFIRHITKEEEPVVTVVDTQRHDLEDGDEVEINHVEGMDGLNGYTVTIKTIDPYKFKIDHDTREYGDYFKGGSFEEVKKKITYQHNSISTFFGANPEDKLYEKMIPGDESKWGRLALYHYLLEALLQFREANDRWTTPGCQEDAEDVLKLVKDMFSQHSKEGLLPVTEEDWLKKLAKGSSAVLSPPASFLGGIIGQEIIKAVSSKYTPLNQWLFCDWVECLPAHDLKAEDCKPRGCRYDSQIAVFGNEINSEILDLNYFLVGCGAIGCEVAKCWSQMGIGAGPGGKVTLTDMDQIEISNLNRQFLFRSNDISKFKSEVAATRIKQMNPDVKVEASKTKVGPETELFWSPDFFRGLDGVCNALDNVNARLYMDSKCVFFKKPLLESGTSGTKGNVQVCVPHVTESYGASVDPPPTDTPVCLLHSFPHNIEHCLQWAREILFEGYFVSEPETTNNYITIKNFIETLSNTVRVPVVARLESTLLKNIDSFESCVIWARTLFEQCYVQQIQQLLYNFPLDYTDQSGAPFWSGSKLPPKPLQFDWENSLHKEFIISAAFLKASVHNLVSSDPLSHPKLISGIPDMIKNFVAPVFVPKKANIITDEKITTSKVIAEYTDDDDVKTMNVIRKLPKPEACKQMQALVFEKDDDSNCHIDFISAAANLRATAYNIKPVTRLESKIIAGKIIPAIVTTTAAVVGLANLELYKLITNKKRPVTDFKNSFINLALPLFQSSEPIKPKQFSYPGKIFTQWDQIDLHGDLTLQQVLDYFVEEHKIEIDLLGVGDALIYAAFVTSNMNAKRNKRITTLIAEATKKPFDQNQKYVLLDLTARDGETDQDIDSLPIVCLWLPPK